MCTLQNNNMSTKIDNQSELPRTGKKQYLIVSKRLLMFDLIM